MNDVEKIKQNLAKKIEDIEKQIEKETQKYSKKIEAEKSDYKKEKLQEIMKHVLSLREHALYTARNEYKNVRPENSNVTQEQLTASVNFSDQLKSTLSDNFHLKFHGSKDIWTSEDIIKSGGIMSGEDRLGHQTSGGDTSGLFSVTDKDTIAITVDSFAGLSETVYPAGCIFVLLPNGETDDKLSKSMQMQNVNFKENPNQLYAIITTTENIDRIKQCCAQNGMGHVPVETYNSILPMIKRDSMILDRCVQNGALDLSSANGIMTALGKDVRQLASENISKHESYYVSAETFCGLCDNGELQSFMGCVDDIKCDCVDNMLNGKSVFICDSANNPIALCSISDDYKLEISYAEQNEVDYIAFDKDTTDYIKAAIESTIEQPSHLKDVLSKDTDDIQL